VALPAARGDLALSQVSSPRICSSTVLFEGRPRPKPQFVTFRVVDDGLCSSNEPCSRMEQPRGRWTFCNKTCG
jgi:hypothetical protein